MANITEFWDFQGGVAFSGGMTAPSEVITTDSQIAAGTDITRAKLVTEANAAFQIPLTGGRIWDTGASLPVTVTGSGAAGDLWFDVGTLGTDGLTLQSDDANGVAYSQYALFTAMLPECYVSGQAITLRIRAKMGVIADTTNGIDAQVYVDADGAAATDICATAVQTMTASWANYDFTITPTSRVAGDELLIRIGAILDDTAAGSGAGVIANIASLKVLCSIKG